MRILYLGRYAVIVGGIERYATQTAAALRRTGHCVDYAAAPAELERNRISSPESVADFSAYFDRLLTFPEVTAAHNAEPYDLAVMHQPGSLANLRQWQAIFGQRLLFIAHDHESYCPRRYFYRLWRRQNCTRPYARLRCAGCALLTNPRHWERGICGFPLFLLKEMPARLQVLRKVRTLVLSDFIKNTLLKNGWQETNIVKIPPFITLPPMPPAPVVDSIMPPAPLPLYFWGQLIRGKGADLLLTIAAELKIPFTLTIIGEGNDREKLLRRAAAPDLADKVKFCNWLPNPADVAPPTAVAVLPFRWQEPFGLVGLEAAARGLPIVTFAVGGVREWLHDGQNGFAVPPLDIKAMQTAITRLYCDPKLRNRLAAAGRDIAAKFSETQFIKNVEQLVN